MCYFKWRPEDESVLSLSLPFSPTALHAPTVSGQGVGIRYAYAVTVSVRRAVQPAPVGRLFGLVRRARSAVVTYSTTDLHVPFTVLSEETPRFATTGSEDSQAPAGPLGEAGGWGAVVSAELEVERIPE